MPPVSAPAPCRIPLSSGSWAWQGRVVEGRVIAMMRFALAVTMVLTLPAPGWAGFDDGLAAFERGDYETAL